jgi:hypothetical protein
VRPMNVTATKATHSVVITPLGSPNDPLDLSDWQPQTRTRAVPESLWGAPIKDRDGTFTQLPQQATANVIDGTAVGAALQAPAPTLGAAVGPLPVSGMYEPVGSPAVDAQSPLAPAVAASSDFVPAFSTTTVADIAKIDAPPALTARQALATELAATHLYSGPNDAMTKLAQNASDLFADAPLAVSA